MATKALEDEDGGNFPQLEQRQRQKDKREKARNFEDQSEQWMILKEMREKAKRDK